MKKTRLFLLFALLVAKMVNGQDPDKKKQLGIFFKDFNLWAYPEEFPYTIKEKISKDVKICIYVKNAKGAATFYTFNNMNKILSKGRYSDALDTFKTYGYRVNEMAISKIKVINYFEPVKDGEWIYYTTKGIIIKREKYDRGNIP